MGHRHASCPLPAPSSPDCKAFQTLTSRLRPSPNQKLGEMGENQGRACDICTLLQRSPFLKLSLSSRHVSRVSFLGHWQIVLSSPFHLEYHTILYHVYNWQDPTHIRSASLTPDETHAHVSTLASASPCLSPVL